MSEFKASLVYRVTARAIQRNSVSKNKQQTNPPKKRNLALITLIYYMSVFAYHSACVEVREQFAEVSSLL